MQMLSYEGQEFEDEDDLQEYLLDRMNADDIAQGFLDNSVTLGDVIKAYHNTIYGPNAMEAFWFWMGGQVAAATDAYLESCFDDCVEFDDEEEEEEDD